LLRLLLLSYLVFFQVPIVTADDDNVISGQLKLEIDASLQSIMGLETQVLNSASFKPSKQVIATAVDMSSLISGRLSYRTASNGVEIETLKLKQIRKKVQRLKQLQLNKAIAPRKLIQAISELELSELNLTQAKLEQQSIQTTLGYQWGTVLTAWALDVKQSKDFQALITRRKQLYQLYIATPEKIIMLHPAGKPQQSQTAMWLAADLQKNTALPSHFYITETGFAENYTQVIAKVALEQTLQGVMIPKRALIWHLGKAFVYLQRDKEHFERVSVDDYQAVNNKQYFIEGNALQAGDNLIIVGAQMLLSEEFKGLIQEEDDDDDDD